MIGAPDHLLPNERHKLRLSAQQIVSHSIADATIGVSASVTACPESRDRKKGNLFMHMHSGCHSIDPSFGDSAQTTYDIRTKVALCRVFIFLFASYILPWHLKRKEKKGLLILLISYKTRKLYENAADAQAKVKR